MKIKIEITSVFGKVLFELEKENNTFKKTLEAAVNSYADLRYANLRYADLRSADLRSANLRYADLRYADLRYADLRSADLRYANLRSADLRYADLHSADLRSANLRYADLRYADLHYASLRYANLRSANLRYADLRYADLHSADLRYAKNLDEYKHLIQIIPEEGSFIAYKKASGCVLKLEIPVRAKRTCNFKNRKCRASMVKTLSITNGQGDQLKEVCGDHDGKTIYKVNRLTHADKFDDTLFNDCTHGIHFFATKREALNW